MDTIVQAISNRVPRFKGWNKRFGPKSKNKKKHGGDGEKKDADADQEGPQTVVGPALSLLRTRKQRSAKLGVRVVVGSIQAYDHKKSKKCTSSQKEKTEKEEKKTRSQSHSKTRSKTHSKSRSKTHGKSHSPRRKKTHKKDAEVGRGEKKSKDKKKKKSKEKEKKRHKKRSTTTNLFGARPTGGSIRSVSKRSAAARGGRKKKPRRASGMVGSVLSMLDEDVNKAREEQPLDPTARDMQDLHEVYQELQGSLNSKKIRRRVGNQKQQIKSQQDLADLEAAASIINAGFKKMSFKPARSRGGQTQGGATGFSTTAATHARQTENEGGGEGGEGGAQAYATHGGGCMLDLRSPEEKAAAAAVRTAGPRKIPALFFNSKKLKPLLEAFVHGGRKCPELVLIDGPSGCGKTWALNQIAEYWKQCTAPANVLTNESFEQAVEQNLPFPNDMSVLLALDDVDALMPKALEQLKKLLGKKKKALKNDSHGMHILMTATDVFAQPRHNFLRNVPKRISLYRSTFFGPLKSFVDSLKLRPKPPDKFVRQAIRLCNGNLHRLLNMLRAHRSTKTLAAGDDSFNVWQEQDLFKQGKLARPPSEKCALMTVFNAPENVFSLATLAELTDRFSESLYLHDPWVFQISDLRVLGKEKAFPSKYLSLNSALKKLNDIYPALCRFFAEWGFEVRSLPMQEHLDAMVTFWDRERAALKKDLHETRRILEVTQLSVDWLKNMDRTMRDRQRAFESRDRDISDELDEMQLKFLMG